MERVESFNENQLEDNLFMMTGLLMTGLFDFVSYAIGLRGTPWRRFAPALILSVVISDPPLVALGAGILEGGKVILGFAILGIFGLGSSPASANYSDPNALDQAQSRQQMNLILGFVAVIGLIMAGVYYSRKK